MLKILKHFLKSELDEPLQEFLPKILAYYHEKFTGKKVPLNRTFIALVYKANTNSRKQNDLRFLNLLMLFFTIGIALIDDVNDNELTSVWDGALKKDILSIASQFLFVFPFKIIQQHGGISRSKKIKLFKVILKYYLSISAGEYQQKHNATNSQAISLQHIIATMTLKTGDWNALQAATALCYVGKKFSADNLYIQFAREVGVLKQMQNDIYDTFTPPQSQDLLNGLYNFPIFVYFISNREIQKCVFHSKRTKISP